METVIWIIKASAKSDEGCPNRRGSGNPTPTIVTRAIRQGDGIAERMSKYNIRRPEQGPAREAPIGPGWHRRPGFCLCAAPGFGAMGDGLGLRT